MRRPYEVKWGRRGGPGLWLFALGLSFIVVRFVVGSVSSSLVPAGRGRGVGCTILPYALATVFRAVQGGCPSEPALQSLDRALTVPQDRRARRATQSPGPGEGLDCLSLQGPDWGFPFPALQAAGRCTKLADRSGSYGWPLTSSRCSRTASFRATATTARFLPFLPPTCASRSPRRRRSESTP